MAAGWRTISGSASFSVRPTARHFFGDDTGNRRFWPVRLGEQAPARTVWDDLTEDIIHQLWAEAVIRYQEGEELILTGALEEVAREQQSEFTEEDPRAGEVQLFLERPAAGRLGKKRQVGTPGLVFR
ncbi:MAG: VapE domain-containing protein [Evtepia sp.]